MTFRFSREKSNLPHSKFSPNEDVLIHLSIDSFYPDLMKKDPEKPGEYVITRMVPPKQIQYYFSITDAPRYRVDIESKTASLHKFPDLKAIQNKGGSIPWRLNISPLGSQNTVQIDLDYLSEINCRPRPEIYIPKKIEPEKKKDKWIQEKSVFKKYRVDTSKILDNCFDFDWECSKCPVMIKNTEERNKIKDFLRKNYRLMRECYRYYSGMNPCGILP